MLCRAAGIEIALEKKVEWILHVDTDELMYPGGAPDYSLQRILASYEDDVDTVVFPNYESLPERDDVKDPFTEVLSIMPQAYMLMTETYLLPGHDNGPQHSLVWGR